MLSDRDIERLADAIAKRREQEYDSCPLGLTPDAVAMVNALARAWRTGTVAATGAVATLLVSAIIMALWYGIKVCLTTK